MNFKTLLEAIKNDMAMDEARGATDVAFDKFAKTAGAEIARICDNVVTKIYEMPGLRSFKSYIDGIPDVDINDPVSIVLNVERYYESWINQLPVKESNDIHRKTKIWFAQYKEKGTPGRKLGSKNAPKDNSAKAAQGLDYTPDEPEITSEPEITAEPKKRGRKPLPPEMRKVYVPTGNPRGRRPKSAEVSSEPVQDEPIMEPTNEPAAEPTMRDLLDYMSQMKAQIEMLQNQLAQRQSAFKDEEPKDTKKIYESLQHLKKQYQRFL